MTGQYHCWTYVKKSSTKYEQTEYNNTLKHIPHNQMGFIPEMQRFFSASKSMWYTTLTNWIINFIYFNRCRKRFWWNSTSIYDKNSLESRNRRNIAQHNKSYIWQTHSKHYPQWWKIESISPKVRNKVGVPTFTATIQHSSGSFGHSNQSRKRNKRNPNWKRRSKTLTVCRRHDPL